MYELPWDRAGNSNNYFVQELFFFRVSIYAWYFRERIEETVTEEKKSLFLFSFRTKSITVAS